MRVVLDAAPAPALPDLVQNTLNRCMDYSQVQFGVGSPQQGDLRLSGPPSGQGASSGARTRDRRVPADLRADSQATVLPTPRLSLAVSRLWEMC
ncbi:hypothetical protein PoB_007714300 [Plakobranchus ocellatus]|uniref:Uncharacterized protein n=1 Tax=Plakobranchus ocellatus TaxID=259542 RepID=A0AAV4E1Z9_9GAST|nr:hypothetical protein PoB_007714300 [Plakobranchus ocellatus]